MTDIHYFNTLGSVPTIPAAPVTSRTVAVYPYLLTKSLAPEKKIGKNYVVTTD